MKSIFKLRHIDYKTKSTTEVDITITKFWGGELHPKINPSDLPEDLDTQFNLYALVKDSDGVVLLGLIKNSLDLLGYKNIVLEIPYIPYGRQDRVENAGESFGLKVFCNYLNSLKFTNVVTYDPHSYVTTALIDNVIGLYLEDVMSFDFSGIDYLVSPDNGAYKKVNKLSQSLPKPLPVLSCNKIRCTETGHIKSLSVIDNGLPLVGKHCMIVDDICDGGRTFISVTEELKKRGADKVVLYVTHGIFSRGKQVLLDNGIDEVYSFSDWED